MTFTEKANKIFNQAIADYHIKDNIDTPINNPYQEGSIENCLYLKCWIDTVQWHFEDIIRDPQIDPAEALVLKRRIDKSNQDRTDLVEHRCVHIGMPFMPFFVFNKKTVVFRNCGCEKIFLLDKAASERPAD